MLHPISPSGKKLLHCSARTERMRYVHSLSAPIRAKHNLYSTTITHTSNTSHLHTPHSIPTNCSLVLHLSYPIQSHPSCPFSAGVLFYERAPRNSTRTGDQGLRLGRPLLHVLCKRYAPTHASHHTTSVVHSIRHHAITHCTALHFTSTLSTCLTA